MLRHILIRPAGQTHGGDLMAYTASELAELYSPGEVAQLAIGKPVIRTTARGMVSHTDLLAFHDRHAAPDLQGTTLLRRMLSRAVLDRPARPQVAA